MPPIMTKVVRHLTQAGRPDTTAYSPAAVPRPVLVLALATVTAAYFLIDRPAADAAGPVVAAAAVATAGGQTLKYGPPAYYGFINASALVYEE